MDLSIAQLIDLDESHNGELSSGLGHKKEVMNHTKMSC